MIDMIREALARGLPPKEIEEAIERDYGVPPLQTCGGEAHGNAYIDNCYSCMPRWGFIGPKVRIT